MIWFEFRRHAVDALAVLISPSTVSIWLATSIIAVVAGPFGTFQTMGPLLRGAYWGLVIASGIALGLLSRAAVRTLCRGWPPLVLDLKIGLATTIALAPVVYLLRAGLDPVLARDDLSLGAIWLNTLVFVLPVLFLRRQFGFEEDPDRHEPPRARLARRLPETLRDAPILRLSGQGHSIEVVTGRGIETLRLRLSDAIEEMEPVEGLCTHRSHWVAREAISGHVTEGGKLFVTLENGDRVPVSRKYRPHLEEMGLVVRQEGDG